MQAVFIARANEQHIFGKLFSQSNAHKKKLLLKSNINETVHNEFYVENTILLFVHWDDKLMTLQTQIIRNLKLIIWQ